MAETKKCPYCGEEILSTAKKCKHCKEWLEVKETPKPFEPKDKVTAKRKNWGWILFSLAIIIVVVLVVSSLNSTFSSSSSENEKLSPVDATNIAKEQQDELDNVINEPAKDTEIEEVKLMLEKSHYTKYSNERFGFSISYPDCFSKRVESENGDGCTFSLRHGIDFSVWGSYNISDLNGESIKYAYMKDDDKASASYKTQKDNWYVLSGKINDEKLYYKKVVLMKSDIPQGSYVSFCLTYPKKFGNVLADFMNNVAKNFNPTFEGSYSYNQQDVKIIDPLKTMQIDVEKIPKKENVQNYTQDQGLALLLLMLAASNSESGFGGSRNSHSCPSCGATFSDGQALSIHTNYTHGY